MKTFKEVYKEHVAITNKNKVINARIKEIENLETRRAAAAAGDREKLAELHGFIKDNETELMKLYQNEYLNNIIIRFLQDNEKASLYNDCKPALVTVLNKYNGKPYGEKTSEKIKAELKALTGCYIWIAAREINISIRNDNYYEIASVRVVTNYDNPVITPENKINAAALENITVFEKYTDNPRKAARDLIKAHKKAYDAIEKAQNELSNYLHAAPRNISNNINGWITKPLYHTIL